MSIVIVTDTLCDVPQNYVDEFGIIVMPLTVHFGEETYKDDGIEITRPEFYRRLQECEELPSTSQVSPGEFFRVFKEELEKNNEILTITGTSKDSGTYNSAVTAKNQFEDNSKIHVVDSKQITLGAALQVIKAAKMVKEGCDINSVVEEIERYRDKIKLLVILDTLKYIRKGGRISASAAVIGTLLNIKPLVTINDGKIELLDKARGFKKGIAMIMDIIEENKWDLNGKTIALCGILADENIALMEEAITSKYKVKEILRGEVGTVLATHTGPGTVALNIEL